VDDEVSERIKTIKRELRELGEDVEQLRKRAARSEDVEQVVAKVLAIETEMRTKFGSLSSQNTEIQSSLTAIAHKLDTLAADLSHQKREVNTLQETNKSSVWARIPALGYVFMAVGLFAILQLGIDKWAEFRGLGR
jgi:chromosome segregation ATPase